MNREQRRAAARTARRSGALGGPAVPTVPEVFAFPGRVELRADGSALLDLAPDQAEQLARLLTDAAAQART